MLGLDVICVLQIRTIGFPDRCIYIPVIVTKEYNTSYKSSGSLRTMVCRRPSYFIALRILHTEPLRAHGVDLTMFHLILWYGFAR